MKFDTVPQAPLDPIFGVTVAFNADERPNKINLGVGIYRTEDLKPALPRAVHEAELRLASQDLPRPYLPVSGDAKTIECLKQLIFHDRPVFGTQTVGATAALRVGGELLNQLLGHKKIYVSDPTWANHLGVMEACHLEVGLYRYYDKKMGGLDIVGMLESLAQMPQGSAVLLHACCHNPTGVGPTKDQWIQIATVVKERELLPFFDCAYQGFGKGLEEDVFAIRHFVDEGIELFLSYSCAKNFGLYGERLGALFIVSSSEEGRNRLGSQAGRLERTLYSNPPAHGAWIVKTILGDEALRASWEHELNGMRGRLQEMRRSLMTALNEKTGRDFSVLGEQEGLFSFIGLEKSQVARLQSDYAIYTPGSGRINVAGLNSANVDYVADAITDVL